MKWREASVFYKCIVYISDQKAWAKSKGRDIWQRARASFVSGLDWLPYLQSIPYNLNPRFKLNSPSHAGNQGLYCATFQGPDTCLDPVEMRSRAKGTDPGNNDGVNEEA